MSLVDQNYFNLTKINYIDIAKDRSSGSEEPKMKGYFVCLMVKPDLNLIQPSAFKSDYPTVSNKDVNEYSEVTQQLKLLKGLMNDNVYLNLTHSTKLQFSDIVSNKCESISYPDIGSNSEDTMVTLDKATYKLPVNETGANGMTFSIRFRENEALDCLRMMSVWHKYIHGVTKGNFRPKLDYVRAKIIDYKASLYTLHLKPDFKTISMFTKYTGIYPTNIPMSAFSEELSQIQDVTFDIEFSYDKFEWMQEDILKEINLLFTKPVNYPFNEVGVKSINFPLITRIKDQPFYHVDFNGMIARLRTENNRLDQLPQAKLGLVFEPSLDKRGKYSKVYFPASYNDSMIDYSTGCSMSDRPPYLMPITRRGNNIINTNMVSNTQNLIKNGNKAYSELIKK